jgi:hypothetical protein
VVFWVFMGFNGDLYGIPTGWWYTYLSTNQYGIPSGNLLQFAIENGPFTVNLHSKNGDFP